MAGPWRDLVNGTRLAHLELRPTNGVFGVQTGDLCRKEEQRIEETVKMKQIAIWNWEFRDLETQLENSMSRSMSIEIGFLRSFVFRSKRK